MLYCNTQTLVENVNDNVFFMTIITQTNKQTLTTQRTRKTLYVCIVCVCEEDRRGTERERERASE